MKPEVGRICLKFRCRWGKFSRASRLNCTGVSDCLRRSIWAWKWLHCSAAQVGALLDTLGFNEALFKCSDYALMGLGHIWSWSLSCQAKGIRDTGQCKLKRCRYGECDQGYNECQCRSTWPFMGVLCFFLWPHSFSSSANFSYHFLSIRRKASLSWTNTRSQASSLSWSTHPSTGGCRLFNILVKTGTTFTVSRKNLNASSARKTSKLTPAFTRHCF